MVAILSRPQWVNTCRQLSIYQCLNQISQTPCRVTKRKMLYRLIILSNKYHCFLLMTLVLVLILNPLLDYFFFLYIKLMCPYFILLIYTDGERDGLWMACPFRTLVVLYRMFPFIICLILMNYLMEFYFIGFVNAHLPGCFCPWTFRLNIGLNTSPSDSFVSYLNSHLGYSAGKFQALQLIVLAVFGAVD